MRLSISCISGNHSQVIQLEVPKSITVLDLQAIISTEIPGVPSVGQHLYHNGRLLSDTARTLETHNMKDDDMVVVHYVTQAVLARQEEQQQQQQQQLQQQLRQRREQERIRQTLHSGPQQGGLFQNVPNFDQLRRAFPQGREFTSSTGSRIEYDCEYLRLQILGDPHLQEQLRESNPRLHATINNPDEFRDVFHEMERLKAESERTRQREIQILNSDPFDVDAQKRIEELIRQEAVMENLQSALEHHPEVTFGKVTMLYVEVEVNGTAVKAFVDSGAQVTVMSPDCASRCGIMRLVDSRFQGMARGVGTAKILGRVHSAQIKIGTLHVPCAFTVMEGKHVDLLLGLDMLKRHQAVIDLKRNSLIIQDEEVPFLGESEIPKDLFNRSEEPTLIGPGGTNMGGIGQVSSPQMHNPQPQQAAAVSSTSRSQGRSTSAITATPSISHPETGIQQLEGLGFSRQQAISALDATNGDVDMAASLLFN